MLKKYLELFVIVALLLAAMAWSQHMDAKADQSGDTATQDKRDTAARHACPPGETVVWVSTSAHECLRELP